MPKPLDSRTTSGGGSAYGVPSGTKAFTATLTITNTNPDKQVATANFEYVENGTYVSLNTGIVQGFMIEPAIDLMRRHAIGPEAKTLPAQLNH